MPNRFVIALQKLFSSLLPIPSPDPIKEKPKGEGEPRNSRGLTAAQMAIHYPHGIPNPPSNESTE
jgi:hypothetical protein